MHISTKQIAKAKAKHRKKLKEQEAFAKEMNMTLEEVIKHWDKDKPNKLI